MPHLDQPGKHRLEWRPHEVTTDTADDLVDVCLGVLAGSSDEEKIKSADLLVPLAKVDTLSAARLAISGLDHPQRAVRDTYADSLSVVLGAVAKSERGEFLNHILKEARMAVCPSVARQSFISLAREHPLSAVQIVEEVVDKRLEPAISEDLLGDISFSLRISRSLTTDRVGLIFELARDFSQQDDEQTRLLGFRGFHRLVIDGVELIRETGRFEAARALAVRWQHDPSQQVRDAFPAAPHDSMRRYLWIDHDGQLMNESRPKSYFGR